MAGIRLRKAIPPNPWPTVAYAVTGTAVLFVVLMACHRHLPSTPWIVAVILLAVVGYIHSWLAVSWTRRVQQLVNAVKRIAEGTDPWRTGSKMSVPAEDLGENVRRAVDELAATVNGLFAEKHRAELVLANMADGIMAVDSATTVTLFNRAASVVLGEKEATVVGSKLADTGLHPEISRVADECLSQRADVTAEIQLPGWPGRVVSLRATPFRTSGTRPDSAIIILHDLTETRQHEKSQREFVANVGHELRTPLTAARVTAEALLSGAKHDEELLDRFLTTIVSEIDRLSTLIDDLLEIVRISSGISSTEKRPCNVLEIVKQAIDPIRPLAAAKNVTVDVEVSEKLSGNCDLIQMTQVVRNLVDNAVKYTPEGGRVMVSATETDSQLVLSVQDTGIGIPQGEKDRVFERFYRVDKARSRRVGGTGLGLAIVKDIVESHDGEVGVETELGRGSTFTVRLPKAAGVVSTDAAEPHPGTKG